jgi:hypothetical protein
MSRQQPLKSIILQKDGAALIAQERQRQFDHGYTAKYDQRWRRYELSKAAEAYAQTDWRDFPSGIGRPGRRWPWPIQKWRPVPHDRVRELTIAGALFQAEADRLHSLGGAGGRFERKVGICERKINRLLKLQLLDQLLQKKEKSGIAHSKGALRSAANLTFDREVTQSRNSGPGDKVVPRIEPHPPDGARSAVIRSLGEIFEEQRVSREISCSLRRGGENRSSNPG